MMIPTDLLSAWPRGTGHYARVLRARACLSRLLLMAAVAGCSSLTDVETDRVERDALDNAAGALALRAGAFQSFNSDVALAAVELVGLMTDELTMTSPSTRNIAADLRRIEDPAGTTADRWLSTLFMVQMRADEAIAGIRRHAPEPASRIGDLFVLRGYAVLLLAEHFCSGLPNVVIEGGEPMDGPSRTTDELLELALAAFDTAAALADGDASVASWAAVGQGRTLLNLGRFSDAAAAVAAVPTGFVREVHHSTATGTNRAFGLFPSRTVADREGGNGLSFVSADDPRLALSAAGNDDGATSWRPAKVADQFSPFVVADGIEARLIEAEAALQSGAVGEWLSIHNALRATQGLPPLADPGVPDARVDLHFEERAFWLFLTVHRLGDLRRLIRQYGRDPEDVFPTGLYKGGPETYGSVTSFPAASSAERNPEFTGCQPEA